MQQDLQGRQSHFTGRMKSVGDLDTIVGSEMGSTF